MPWFPRDFASSTRGWPLVAKGAYRELLDVQWDMGSLPAEPRHLRRICGASESEWRRVWPLLGPKLPIAQDSDGNPTEFRLNLKLELHRADSVSLYEKRKKSSQLANAARWQSDPPRMPNGSHQSQSQSQSSELTIVSSSSGAPKGGLPEARDPESQKARDIALENIRKFTARNAATAAGFKQ